MMLGAQSDDEALELYIRSRKLLKTAGFNLRKFTTNSSKLQARIDQDEMNIGESKDQATLGNSHAPSDTGISQSGSIKHSKSVYCSSQTVW